jgi:uncharacterized protein YjeT (DUF2065 family)
MLLILEGVLPFLAPQLWRDTFRKLTELSDGQLRFIGLISMALGVVSLVFLQHA